MPAMKATSVWSSPCPRRGLKRKSKRTRVVITGEVDVKKADGTVENWAIEAGPPGTLVRAGFTKESLAAKTVIKINGYRAKDGALRANGRDITLPDGRLLFVGGSGPGSSGPGAPPKDPPGEKK